MSQRSSQNSRRSGVLISPNRYSLLDIEHEELEGVLTDFTSVLDEETKDDCPDCKKYVENGVQCEICDRWYHGPCQKMNKTTQNFLQRNANTREPNNKVHWWCNHCGLGAERIVKTLGKVKRQSAEVARKIDSLETDEETLKDLKLKTEEHQKWFDKNLPIINEDHARVAELVKKGPRAQQVPDGISDRLKECEDAIKKFEELSNQFPPLGTPGGAGPEVASPDHAQTRARITRNVADRLDRRNNVIVFGLKESPSNLKSEIEAHDKEQIDELCQVTAEGKFPYTLKRLGKRVVDRDEEDRDASGTPGGSDSSNSRPKYRPLLVSFDREDNKVALMTNLYKLGGKDVPETLKKVSVKHDFSPEEREIDRNLQREAKEKNEENSDLTKVYVVRGPPWERRVKAIHRKTRAQVNQNQNGEAPIVFHTHPSAPGQTATSNGLPGLE